MKKKECLKLHFLFALCATTKKWPRRPPSWRSRGRYWSRYSSWYNHWKKNNPQIFFSFLYYCTTILFQLLYTPFFAIQKTNNDYFLHWNFEMGIKNWLFPLHIWISLLECNFVNDTEIIKGLKLALSGVLKFLLKQCLL